MEVLLLQDIKGVGKKNDLLVIGNGYALNSLLPDKLALVATPTVRKRYAEQIRSRAEQRETERLRLSGKTMAIRGKRVTIQKKATKTGKLYAAVSAKDIAEALLGQLNVEIDEKAIVIEEHLKAVGTFDVKLHLADNEEVLKVTVEELKK